MNSSYFILMRYSDICHISIILSLIIHIVIWEQIWCNIFSEMSFMNFIIHAILKTILVDFNIVKWFFLFCLTDEIHYSKVTQLKPRSQPRRTVIGCCCTNFLFLISYHALPALPGFPQPCTNGIPQCLYSPSGTLYLLYAWLILSCLFL